MLGVVLWYWLLTSKIIKGSHACDGCVWKCYYRLRRWDGRNRRAELQRCSRCDGGDGGQVGRLVIFVLVTSEVVLVLILVLALDKERIGLLGFVGIAHNHAVGHVLHHQAQELVEPRRESSILPVQLETRRKYVQDLADVSHTAPHVVRVVDDPRVSVVRVFVARHMPDNVGRNDVVGYLAAHHLVGVHLAAGLECAHRSMKNFLRHQERVHLGDDVDGALSQRL